MTNRKKRRSWSDEEKREISARAALPGASITQAAPRYSANANMMLDWLKGQRFAPVPLNQDNVEDGSLIELELAPADCLVTVAIVVSPSVPARASRVDIIFSDGRWALIEGPPTLTAVMGLVQGLME